MTDHKTEAEILLRRRDITDRVAAVAQVHATLALAEQQRLTNILLWGRSHGFSDATYEEIRKGLRL